MSTIGACPQHQKDVQYLLQECGDSSIVEYDTIDEPPLYLFRHRENKVIFLVCTKFYVYLFKGNGSKLYFRWTIRDLTVASDDRYVCLSTSEVGATDLLDEHISNMQDGRRGAGSDDEGSSGDEDDDLETLAAKYAAHYETVVLEASDDASARRVSATMALRINETKRYLWRLEADEEGRFNTQRTRRVSFTMSDEEDEEEEEVEEVESSDDEAAFSARGLRAPLQGSQNADGLTDREHKAQSAAWRSAAIAAIVDSEVVDYGVLRQAFQRREDRSLLTDLQAFVEENDTRISDLCKKHFPSFLNAASQCRAITATDAVVVQAEMNGALKLVRKSAQELRSSAARLIGAIETKDNLSSTTGLIAKLCYAAEQLETAEVLISQAKYLGAISVVQELISVASASLSSYLLGEYVLKFRAPAIRHAALMSTLAQTNQWLSQIRDGAVVIGEALVAQRLYTSYAPCTDPLNAKQAAANFGVVGGRQRILFCHRRHPERWGIVDEYVPSEPLMEVTASALLRIVPAEAPGGSGSGGGGGLGGAAASGRWDIAGMVVEEASGTSAAVLESIMRSGPSLQEVFNVAGQGEGFVLHYATNRRKQVDLDLKPAVLATPLHTDGVLAAVLGAAASTGDPMIDQQLFATLSPLARFLSYVLGTMVLEDAVHYTTTPKVQSVVDIVALWETLSYQVASRAIEAANVLMGIAFAMGDGGTPFDVLFVTLVRLLAAFATLISGNVRSADMNLGNIHIATESIMCRMHSVWLQQHCGSLGMALAADNLVPMTVSSASDFDLLIVQYQLHLVPVARINGEPLRLPVPTSYLSGQMLLPFSRVVASVANEAFTFLDRCLRVLNVNISHKVKGTSEGASLDHILVAAVCTTSTADVGRGPARAPASTAEALASISSAFVSSAYVGLNNVDAMLLEYLSVLFKSAAGTLSAKLTALIDKTAILQLAVVIGSAQALAVVVSAVEQRFALWWRGNTGANFSASADLATISENDLACLGSARLLQPSQQLFLNISATATDRLVRAVFIAFEEHLTPLRQLNYWRRKLPSNSLFSIIGNAADEAARKDGVLVDVGFQTAVSHFNSLLPKLQSLLSPGVVQSVIQSVVLRSSELLFTNISEAIKSYSGNEIPMIRACIDVVERDLAPIADQWCASLAEACPPEGGGVYAFPFTIPALVDSLRAWATAREAYWRDEAEREMKLKASLEAAGMKVLGGVKDAGNATKKGFFWMGRTAKSTATGAVSAATGKLGSIASGALPSPSSRDADSGLPAVSFLPQNGVSGKK